MRVQSLLDSGKTKDAESAVRSYLDTHASSADAHYLLGYILFREGNPKSSLTEYMEGQRYRAPSSLDLEVVGSDYFLMEDYAAAAKWFSKALELDSTDALAQFYLGRARFHEKRFDEAVAAFAECLKLNPKNVSAADNLGLSYQALSKNEDALKAFRNAIAADVGATAHDPGPYLNLGTLLVEIGQWAEAIPHLLRVVEMMPAESRAHRQLAKAYLQLNRLEEAQTELNKASEPPLKEARSLIEKGNLSAAERLTREYLELHKNSADGHYLLGYILFKKEDAKSSLAEYTEGAKYRTPSAADLEAVAGDYVLLKDYPDADKWFTKAVEWNPNDALGWYYLGRTKYSENRFEEAISAFQKCLGLDPRNVKAEDNLGLSYEGLNRTDDAMAAYHTSIAWQADSPVKNQGPLLNLGSLLVENDRAQEALPYLLEAAKISAQDYRVYRQLGKAYAHLNQLEKARTEFEHAVELAPGNAPIHFMLAQVYRRQGLFDKAKAEAEIYAKLSESGPSKEK